MEYAVRTKLSLTTQDEKLIHKVSREASVYCLLSMCYYVFIRTAVDSQQSGELQISLASLLKRC